MNRYTAFFLAALVTIVVACNMDRPTSQQNSGIQRIPFAAENLTANPNNLKFQVGTSTWTFLTAEGDFVATRASLNDSVTIRSGHVTAKYDAAGVDIPFDTIGAGTLNFCNSSTGSPTRQVNVCAATAAGNALWFSTSIHSYPVRYGVNQGGIADTLFLSHVYGNPLDPDSLTFTASASGTRNDIRGVDLLSDNVGSIRMYGCATAPTCAFGLRAPASATLANNGPFNAKITWSNNGDASDSTEIWFGKSGSETKQSVQPNSTTSYVVSFSGPGLYDAWVFHRWNSSISPKAFTNSLTH